VRVRHRRVEELLDAWAPAQIQPCAASSPCRKPIEKIPCQGSVREPRRTFRSPQPSPRCNTAAESMGMGRTRRPIGSMVCNAWNLNLFTGYKRAPIGSFFRVGSTNRWFDPHRLIFNCTIVLKGRMSSIRILSKM
jgi:hypothetical protein